MPSKESGLAVTKLVVSANRRPSADRPSAAVAATPPQAPTNHIPTRRSLIEVELSNS